MEGHQNKAEQAMTTSRRETPSKYSKILLQLKKEEHIEQSKCQRVKVLELAQGASICKSVESSKSRINVSEYHHLLFSHHEPRWRGTFGEENSLNNKEHSYQLLRCVVL